MVFNEENYPNMVRLFEELGVGAEKTDMSFRCPVTYPLPRLLPVNVSAL